MALALAGGAMGGPPGAAIGAAAGVILGVGIYAIWDQLWNENTEEGEEGDDSCPTDSGGTIYVDPQGNAIPTPQGGGITGSPEGSYIQGRDAKGNMTGVRKDGGHNPAGHPDPRAQQPHGHVPGVSNPDGTPWLPVK